MTPSNFPSQRVTMITLAVADLAISRQFYGALGFTEADGGNDMIAFYKLSGQFFALYSRDALAQDMGLPISGRTTGATTLATNYPTEAEVDAAFARALEAGAVAIAEPAKAPWGGYSALIADPDGHMWEYAMNPFWSYDADGQVMGAP